MKKSSRIVAIASANPGLRTTQTAVYHHLIERRGLSEKALTFYKRFLSDKGIQTRYFGLASLEEAYTETCDEAAARFQKAGAEIAIKALKDCLKRGKLKPKELDGLVVATCTGYLCPGFSSYLSEAVGLREDVFTLDLVGHGCGAAVPALRAADQFLKSGSGKTVVALCVEVCSAAIFWGDETDLILSNAIFADGAAACLLKSNASEPGFDLLGFESLLWPQYRDELRFQRRECRLCNVIKKSVPVLTGKAVKQLMQVMTHKQPSGYQHYAVHPGGRRILDEVQKALHLSDADMVLSRDILRRYGNMSSPSVLFVLERLWEKTPPKEGETTALLTFGAGFTVFGSSLRYHQGTVS